MPYRTDPYHDTYAFCYKHEMVVWYTKGGSCPECKALRKKKRANTSLQRTGNRQSKKAK